MLIYTIFLFLMLLLAIVVLIVITSAFLGFLLTRVPFVPTAAKDIEFVVDELGISGKDIFFDLGSGDGKVVFLVHELSGAKCVGYELTWWTHLLAKIKAMFKGVSPDVQFKNQNFFKQSWSEADYVYGYLYPPLMGRVEEKFLNECKPGSTAVIRDFPLPNLKPVAVYNRPRNHEIYIYKKQ